MPGHEPVLGLDPPPIDPQFTFAHDALNMAEGEAWMARFEKTIDAHSGFIRADDEVLHAEFVLAGAKSKLGQVLRRLARLVRVFLSKAGAR